MKDKSPKSKNQDSKIERLIQRPNEGIFKGGAEASGSAPLREPKEGKNNSKKQN